MIVGDTQEKKSRKWSKAARKALKMRHRMRKYWAKMSAEEREKEMQRRMGKRNGKTVAPQEFLTFVHGLVDQANRITYDPAGRLLTMELRG